eukprot:TRINITY_DN2184_c0_g1_i1.p1 TRINITY_DN2184_c0_g1~~TRINITY_DN2184_c0_g1_i1.p1  ORF type:complete len:434 (-),score=50.33 TRINITY_DN2184_c0_g1_i1:492-1793(-)
MSSSPKTSTVTSSSEVQSPPSPSKHRRRPSKNSFASRSSHLDRPQILQSEFRGFFNLFGLILFIFCLTAQTRHIMYNGTLVGLEFAASLFSRIDLFPAWVLLCSLSLTAFLLVKVIVLGYVRNPTSIKMLYISAQVLILSYTIAITMERKWPTIQAGFLVIELLVLMMKMHSYFVTNRELATASTPVATSSTIAPSIQYPQNVTLKNYIYFLVVPTLVYELEYPRTERVRPAYVVEKVATLAAFWAALQILNHNYLQPVMMRLAEISVVEATLQMAVPALFYYLFLFYILFDVCCNGIAEITRFADRRFYHDWWNCTTWDEFARKWNIPVHEFLLRHVYLETINTYKISDTSAAVVTFLLSSVAHEFVMTLTLRVFRPWLFIFQMTQLPLIFVGRRLKGTQLGNILFWCCIMLGPPLISVLYLREYALSIQLF